MSVSDSKYRIRDILLAEALPHARQSFKSTLRAASAIMLVATTNSSAYDLSADFTQAWSIAEQRSTLTVNWMNASYGTPAMYARYPSVGDTVSGNWFVVSNTRDWRNGFWQGTLWLLAQHTGNDLWRQRATDWSAALATTTNVDHDIGFITVASLGKGWFYHDDLTDPGGACRNFAKTAILTAAAKLDSRFNQANTFGTPIPAGFTRSWNTPFQDPYPVCVDNLMNLEVMFLGYELSGMAPVNRPWFDHALAHARTSIARHLRVDGSTYHVVKHFESGPQIGQVERKSTLQGYGDETTWSRGQAWAIYGLTTVYRHARKDPTTDASDILSAAMTTADYFIDHLPDNYLTDIHNHRVGDFVPPCDFDASLGEATGPWNDADDNYNSASGTGLGDRKPATLTFTLRDSSAAAIAASGLIELSGFMTNASDKARYLQAAEDILHCLITYDGPDSGTDPDYLCAASDTANPGILKAGCVRWGEVNRSVIYGDYYFLEAMARHEVLVSRQVIEKTKEVLLAGSDMRFQFEIPSPAPALSIRLMKSPDLADGTWTTLAYKTGAGTWNGPSVVTEETLPNNLKRVWIADPSPGAGGFFRIQSRSIGGDGP